MKKQTLLNMVEAQTKSKFGVYFSLNCQCYNITPQGGEIGVYLLYIIWVIGQYFNLFIN